MKRIRRHIYCYKQMSNGTWNHFSVTCFDEDVSSIKKSYESMGYIVTT